MIAGRSLALLMVVQVGAVKLPVFWCAHAVRADRVPGAWCCGITCGRCMPACVKRVCR